MIDKKFMQFVTSDYVRIGERLVGYKFKRELNRYSQIYSFYLFIVVESELTGLRTDRCILLGTNKR